MAAARYKTGGINFVLLPVYDSREHKLALRGFSAYKEEQRGLVKVQVKSTATSKYGMKSEAVAT